MDLPVTGEAVTLVLFTIDRVKRTRYYHLADAINNLSCGVVSTGVRVFFGFLGIFFYEWVLLHWAPIHLPANHWATWVFAFILYDLCYYWSHRWGHTVAFAEPVKFFLLLALTAEFCARNNHIDKTGLYVLESNRLR